MPSLINADGSAPTPGQLWPQGGWSVLPPGLAGLQGVEVWPTFGGSSWFVEVGSPAWNAWASRAATPKPVPSPRAGPVSTPQYVSAFDADSAITGADDVLPPAGGPPVVLLPGSVMDSVPAEPACSCDAPPAGGRSLWWLVLAGLFLWMM